MFESKRHLVLAAAGIAAAVAVGSAGRTMQQATAAQATPSPAAALRVVRDESAGTIKVFRPGSREPVLTQNAPPDARPYLHPIAAPDGRGAVTEFSPSHHKHQTGLYWGFTRVNGRDFFHNPQGDYWRRVSFTVLRDTGDEPRGGRYASTAPAF
jgi:hypothetical protein